MIKPGKVWGTCPYRRLTLCEYKHGLKAFYYKCIKMDCPCNSNYCLGPDEDREANNEAKGETHE